MKIVQVINSLLPGGAEKLLVNSIVEYKKKGVDVDLLLLYGEKTPFYDYLKSKCNVKIISLGNNGFVYNPKYIFKLNKFLKQYDLIHVHLFPCSYWVALANLISFKKHKIVFTEHSSSNKRRNYRLFKLLDQKIYRQFNEIITISNSVDFNLKNHLGPKFININKVYNGIDLEEVEKATAYKKSELNFDNNAKLIIQVSSFRYPKDQDTVIKAIPKLPSYVNLLLIGDGELKAKSEDLSNKLNLNDRVHFLGIRSDVVKLLKTSDIVILSSYYEGLSLSSVEGMASGKPFIASNSPGLNEVVVNAGILFPAGDTDALIIQIEKLLNDSNHYNKIVSTCLKRSKLFDINFMVDKYINLYKKILSSPN